MKVYHQKEQIACVYDAVNNVYFCEATDSIQYHPPDANLDCDSVYFHRMYVCIYYYMDLRLLCTRPTCMYIYDAVVSQTVTSGYTKFSGDT